MSEPVEEADDGPSHKLEFTVFAVLVAMGIARWFVGRLQQQSSVGSFSLKRYRGQQHVGEAMSELASETIALRAILLFVFGIVLLAAISGYTARPSRSGPVSLWLGIPIIPAKICVLLGPSGLLLIVARATKDLSQLPRSALFVAVGALSFWLSAIVIQVAQNIAYRVVGARTQKIRWFH